jgi:hypothetical protein
LKRVFVPPTTRPALLTLLALLVALEAVGVSIYTIWYGTQLFVAEVGTLGGALFLFGLFILFSVWLWSLTVGLFLVRRWARSGTIVWQTIQVVVGVSMINAEGDWVFVAIGMILLGLGCGVLTFTPSVTKVTARQSSVE